MSLEIVEEWLIYRMVEQKPKTQVWHVLSRCDGSRLGLIKWYLDWVVCEHCEDGYSGHDCGEDTCCCRYPEPNVVCDVCDGKGGWYVCPSCDREIKTHQEEAAEA